MVNERSELSTVINEYIPTKRRSGDYQSEEDLEEGLIRQLQGLGYEYKRIREERELVSNLREQLETLNNIAFTNREWDIFYSQVIANKREGIKEKTRKIQEERTFEITLEDGSKRNIKLIDDEDITNNKLQVTNQYTVKGKRETRFDVSIMVNGIPLVHIELKRRGVSLREAFNQISRYQRDSFWVSSGLFEYVQIFVISNGTHTKYYSNTTRESQVREQRTKNRYQNFQFTTYWADSKNNNILDLEGFADTFLKQHTLLKVLTKYCVFNSDQELIVLRPYQIEATERILDKIKESTINKTYGTVNAGGYVWHSTGSGKTLTSFKVAKIATENQDIAKVIFVVDRQDLDYQTMREYNKFEDGSVSGNTSTRKLIKQLDRRDKRIIVTTIQKLSRFAKSYDSHALYNEKVVFIFDEAHRSQFGDMHQEIIKKFKKYYLFGFTGTPIFAENAIKKSVNASTTEQIFGEQIHAYTMVDAIKDRNVLPFKVDYVNTFKKSEDIEDAKVEAIDTQGVLMSDKRISNIVDYILTNYKQKTNGFNSILAVSSIPMAIKYYLEFEERVHDLKVATIYSYNPNEDTERLAGLLGEEVLDTGRLDKSSRDFLELAIEDYNNMFGTTFNTGNNFESYYKDVSTRMKNKEIDLLIVVNMFLTGFDAPKLNTIWVDKDLRHHGLIQTISRTNRIYNDAKQYGNIITFRNIKENLDKALMLFGDKDAKGTILIRPYEDYYYGYEENGKYTEGYRGMVYRLEDTYPLEEEIIGERAIKEYISLYGTILRVKNLLNGFDEFKGNELMNERDFQDYKSRYLDYYHEYRKKVGREGIQKDISFEMELVHRDDVNVDYIIDVLEEYKNTGNKDLIINIRRIVESSVSLRSKKDLIETFIDKVNTESDKGWDLHIQEQMEQDIETMYESHKNNIRDRESLLKYIKRSITLGELRTHGTELDKLIVASMFRSNGRSKIKKDIIVQIEELYEKYKGLIT